MDGSKGFEDVLQVNKKSVILISILDLNIRPRMGS